MEQAAALESALAAAGLDVLVDDRDQRPGFKFKDADLIGIPLRVVVGERGLKEGKIEVKWRDRVGGEAASAAATAADGDPRRDRRGRRAGTTIGAPSDGRRGPRRGRHEPDVPPAPAAVSSCSAC